MYQKINLKEKIPTLIFFIILLTTIQAQNKNNVYLELLGNGGVYSINYERNIFDSFNARIGFMYTSEEDEHISTIPFLINYHLITSKYNYIEIGLGFTYISGKLDIFWRNDLEVSETLLTGSIGYCINPNDALNFRLAFTPFYDKYNGGKVVPFGGISVGYKF